MAETALSEDAGQTGAEGATGGTSAMFPVFLDLARLPVLLAGNGPVLAKRVRQLREAGARHLVIHAPNPEPEMIAAAGELLLRRLPEEADILAARVLWLADLPQPELARLAAEARRLGRLVNVEDDIPLCDFHTPSIVRRGDLVVAISTAGKSPALAVRLRQFVERCVSPEWAGRLERLARARLRWRAEGADMKTVMQRSNALIDAEGWLPPPPARPAEKAPLVQQTD